MQIVSDTHFKNLSIDQATVEKPKTELGVGLREERSSDFRAGLFSKLSMSKTESRQGPKIFADSVVAAGGKVPTSMRLGTSDFGRSKEKLSESGMVKVASKLSTDVEKMVSVIDERMKENSYKGSVSVESFKRSIYGRFSDTYKRLKAVVDPDQLNVVMSTSFKGSNIVSHAEGTYFI